MTTYVVGDIQGCLEPLQRVLAEVGFEPGRDTLWATGDLVNRGPASLATLRFCYGLGDSFRTVLGNHDLHLLAVARGHRKPNRKDTLDDVLRAPDQRMLMDWLQQHPLLFSEQGFTVVHAGIPPQWSIGDATALAAEIAAVLSGNDAARFFSTMYGNDPDLWHADLAGPTRWRVITNYLTRMRFCDPVGRLDLQSKEGLDTAPPGMAPWFSYRYCLQNDERIVFGHWAALEGAHCGPGLYPLDTGCVWGGRLRLMRLDNREYVHCPC